MWIEAEISRPQDIQSMTDGEIKLADLKKLYKWLKIVKPLATTRYKISGLLLNDPMKHTQLVPSFFTQGLTNLKPRVNDTTNLS